MSQSTSLSDLAAAKRKIAECLGDRMHLYLQNIKAWFKQKITKEEFDYESRQILPSDSAHLHNEFLLAIFMKCQRIPVPKESPTAVRKSEPKKLKVSSSPQISQVYMKFSEANPLTFAPQASVKSVEDPPLNFCSRDMTLPDSVIMHFRMYVIAWEAGLEEVEDQSISMVLQAVENLLKDIISILLATRNGFKLREGRFRYAMGSHVPNPYLRHTAKLHDYSQNSESLSISTHGAHCATIRPSPDLAEENAIQTLACVTHSDTPKKPASLLELFTVLQSHKNTIPSHTIYTTTMERIIHSLWHPSHEDMKPNSAKKQTLSSR